MSVIQLVLHKAALIGFQAFGLLTTFTAVAMPDRESNAREDHATCGQQGEKADAVRSWIAMYAMADHALVGRLTLNEVGKDTYHADLTIGDRKADLAFSGKLANGEVVRIMSYWQDDVIVLTHDMKCVPVCFGVAGIRPASGIWKRADDVLRKTQKDLGAEDAATWLRDEKALLGKIDKATLRDLEKLAKVGKDDLEKVIRLNTEVAALDWNRGSQATCLVIWVGEECLREPVEWPTSVSITMAYDIQSFAKPEDWGVYAISLVYGIPRQILVNAKERLGRKEFALRLARLHTVMTDMFFV